MNAARKAGYARRINACLCPVSLVMLTQPTKHRQMQFKFSTGTPFRNEESRLILCAVPRLQRSRVLST